MNTETNQMLEHFLNRLTNNDIDYIDIIGLNVAIIYSKEIFKRNKDISQFLVEIYNINFRPYVMKSRTLIVARITRELHNKTHEELNEIRLKLINYLNPNTNISEKKNKSNKKQDSNEKLKKWIEGL